MNDALQQLVRNWLIKAGNDLKIGRDQMKTADPTTDMVCYHMQQCDDFYMPTRKEAESSIEIALFAHEFIRAKLF